MNNLFIVESPLQASCAVEAKKNLKIDNAVIIVILSDNTRKENNKQIHDIINKEQWFKKFELKNDVNFIARELRLFSLLIYLRYLKLNNSRVFIGEYRNINMLLIASLCRVNEFIILDDGAFTITAQQYYVKNRIPPFKFQSKSEKIKYLIVSNFFSNENKLFELPNYYSFFNLSSCLLDGQINYRSNDNLRKIKNIDKGVVYFYGSKFTECGYLTEENELNLLCLIYEQYKNKSVYYIPHRDESEAKLIKIAKIGFIIKYFGVGAENFFKETLVMPEIVSSFYSTVLYSCFIYCENVKIDSYYIADYLRYSDVILNANSIYSYYAKVGIKVNNLDFNV